jgi:hypothetical protein
MIGRDQTPDVGKDTQFKPGESGNPAGKPAGTKHIATWVQEMLNDPEFTARILDSNIGIKEFKGPPLKAIIEVAIVKAINGDQRWAKWLSDNGWGTKIELGGELTLKKALVEFVGDDDGTAAR